MCVLTLDAEIISVLQCRMIYGYSTMQPYVCLNQMMKKQGNYVGAAAMCLLGGKSSSEKAGQCH